MQNDLTHILIDQKEKHVLEFQIENVALLRQILIEFDLVRHSNIEIQIFKDGHYTNTSKILEQNLYLENIERTEEHPILVTHIDQKEPIKQKDDNNQEILNLQQSILEIDQENSDLKDGNKKLKEDNRKLEQIIKESKQQSEQYYQTMIEQQMKISKLEHSEEEQQKLIEQQQQSILEQQMQISKFSKLEQSNKEYQKLIEQQQQSILEQQIQISKFEISIKEYKQQIKEQNQSLNELETKIKESEKYNAQLKQLVETSNSVREMVKLTVQEFDEEKQQKDQIISQLQYDIEQLKQKILTTRKEKIELIDKVLQIEEAYRQMLESQKIKVGPLIKLVQKNPPQQQNDQQQNQDIKIEQKEQPQQKEQPSKQAQKVQQEQEEQDVKQKSDTILQIEIKNKLQEINQLKKALESAIDNELNYQIPHDYKSEKVYINFVCRRPGHEGNPIGQICLQDRCKQSLGCLFCSTLHNQNHTTMPIDQFFNCVDQVKQMLKIEDYWEKVKFQFKQFKEYSFMMILKIKEQNQNITKQINSVYRYLSKFNESDPSMKQSYIKMILDSGKEISQVMDQSLQTIIASTDTIRNLNLINCHFCQQLCDQNNEDESEVYISECGHSLHRSCFIQLVEKQVINTQAKCLCHAKLSLSVLSNKNNSREAKLKMAILDNQLDQIREDLSMQISNCPNCRFFCIRNDEQTSYCPQCDKKY